MDGLTPFQRALVEKAIRRGDTEWAERLLALFAQQNAEAQEAQEAVEEPKAEKAEEEAPNPPKRPLSPIELLRSLKEASLRHALTGSLPEGPAWERAKAQALRLYRRAGGALPVWQKTRRYGRKAGPGALVVLLMALVLFHRVSDRERQMLLFAPIWVLAHILGVSRDSVERWLKDHEVQRYVGYALYRVEVKEGWRVAGVILRIRLTPLRPGERVGGPDREAYRLPLRDLPADIRLGLTEAQTQSDERQYRSEDQLRRKVWSLVVPLGRDTLSRLRSNPSVIYIAALGTPARSKRPEWVENLARALATHLQDLKNLDWWRKVAWTALRGLLLGSRFPLNLLERGLTLLGEVSGIRNRAAFLTAFLKREGLQDFMAFAGSLRVGVGYAAG